MNITVEITRVTRCVERYVVCAPTLQEVRQIWESGEANLKDDEVTDVYEERARMSATGLDVTDEIFGDPAMTEEEREIAALALVRRIAAGDTAGIVEAARTIAGQGAET